MILEILDLRRPAEAPRRRFPFGAVEDAWLPLVQQRRGKTIAAEPPAAPTVRRRFPFEALPTAPDWDPSLKRRVQPLPPHDPRLLIPVTAKNLSHLFPGFQYPQPRVILARSPLPVDPRVRRFTEILTNIVNSLGLQDLLVQTGPSSWSLSIPESLSETARDNIASPRFGVIVFNETTRKLNFWNGSAWEEVTSSV